MKFIGFLLLCFFVSPLPGQELTKTQADSVRKILPSKNPDIELVQLLFKLAEYYILKPGELQIDFDSAGTYLKKVAEMNQQWHSVDIDGYGLILEAKILKELDQRELGKEKMEEAICLLQAGSNNAYLGKAFYEYASFFDYWEKDQRLKMTTLVEQSVTAYEKSKDLYGWATSLKMLGDLYNINGDGAKALETLKKSLVVYDSIQYKGLQGIYALMGRLYNQQSDYKQALSYELKALTLAESYQDSSMNLCQIHNLLAMIYSNMEQHDKAILHYKLAFDIANRFKDQFNMALLVMNIVGNYNQDEFPQQGLDFLSSLPDNLMNTDDVQIDLMISLAYFSSYLANKRYAQAKSYCEKLLRLVETKRFRENNPVKDDVYRTVVKYYLETGQLEKARFYLDLNKENIKYADSPIVIGSNAALWYKVDSADHNFKSAFDHLLQYHTIKDSIYQATKSRQFQLLLVEYDTKKKEDSIRQASQNIVFLTQKNDQIKRIRNVILAGTSLTLIILFLLYRQYRIKQKSNQIITIKNDQLRHLLTEKEWLLKEIHHRVKNNLQVVMSILNTQSSYIDNDVALAAIQTSQNRVHAMSLIHQKLYNSDNVSTINMSSYIQELVLYLRDSYTVSQRIRFEFKLDPLTLDVSQAIPLGLILNEAITNSIKYAFPMNRKGVIEIGLSQREENKIILSIWDNGIGFPSDFQKNKRGSLGMSLMEGLSGDLDGTFSIENNEGTLIKINFTKEMPVVPNAPNLMQPELAMS